MGGVLTIAATVAAAAGAVAAFRFIERRRQDLSDLLDSAKGDKSGDAKTVDYERDPETGVYRPRR
jgi:predicted nucleic-acid-binding protein